MPDISKQYEKRLDKEISKAIRKIRAIYNDSIQEISFATYVRYGNLSGTTFELDKFPALKKMLNNLTKSMHDKIVKAIEQAINDSWDLSNQKNDQIATEIIQRVFPQTINTAIVSALPGTSLIFNPNHDALKAFTKRVESGMNLSERVWNLVRPYKFELEAGLTDGINRGLSASKMATNLKRYLNEPERLFRRVRDEKGKLQLSKAAKAYHPGQGVYRSSFKNALRLTGSETNMAFKIADSQRWKNESFVKGIEIHVSHNHPLKDQCDILAGDYPPDFVFVPFHPFCRCYAIPILISDEEFSKQEDVLLGISSKIPKIKKIEKIPARATKWYEENSERIKGWKNKPYPIKYNPKYLGKYG